MCVHVCMYVQHEYRVSHAGQEVLAEEEGRLVKSWCAARVWEGGQRRCSQLDYN